MLRFSLTTLSFIAAGLLQIAPGMATDVLADDSVIWIEPVSRDYGRTWKKKTAAPRSSEARTSGRHGGSEQRGRPGAAQEPSAAIRREGARRAGNRRDAERGTYRVHRAIVRAGVFPYTEADLSEPTISGTRFWLELPDNGLIPVEPQKKRGRYRVELPRQTGGNYRLVGYNGNYVADGTRRHLYTYYSFMSHGDKPETQPRDSSPRPGFHIGKPIFEIIRLYDSERHRFRTRAGHRLRVRVLYKGNPVVYAPVTLTTSENWHKKLATDERGEAEFTLIKEDFQRGVFDTRKSTLYMLQAEQTEISPGDLGGSAYEHEKYVATLSMRVFPDSNEWESKYVAFLVMTFTVLIVGAAIILHRTGRRNKA